MKITHVIIGLGVGGAELMLKRLVEGLNGQEGMQHSVISLTELGIIGRQLQDAGIKVNYLGMSNALSLPKTFFRLRRELKKQQPDIVQTWMYHADFLGGLAARTLGIKNIIWGVRNTYLESSGKINFLFRKLCSILSNILPKEIVYVSNSAKEEHQKSGYTKRIGKVINNGFDINKYRFNLKSKEKVRSEIELATDDVAIFSIGRYTPAKDHATFIEAVLIASKKNPKIKGCLVGRDINLDNFLLTPSQKQQFVVLGQRDDVSDVLSAANIFCLHSITEGFPNVLGEAMSVGVPCITTKAGDAALILNDERFVLEIQDKQGLAEKIVFLSRIDDEERSFIGIKNRERVKEFYSLDKILNEYFLLYREIL